MRKIQQAVHSDLVIHSNQNISNDLLIAGTINIQRTIPLIKVSLSSCLVHKAATRHGFAQIRYIMISMVSPEYTEGIGSPRHLHKALITRLIVVVIIIIVVVVEYR